MGADIDWEQVRASGVQFVIARAGYIASQDRPRFVADEHFADNIHDAQAHGMAVGAYIYLYNFTEEGLADGLIDFDMYMDEHRLAIDLPVFLDVEDKEYFKPGTDELGGATYVTNLTRFGMERLREMGYDAGFYTFNAWVGREIYASSLYEEGYPFWLARWYKNNSELDPATESWDGMGQPSIWQYRATGIIPGIEKEVDMNYLYWERMPGAG